MLKLNDNYLKLPGSYLFSTIAKKVSEFVQANPDKKIIKLGIGDVTLPLTESVIRAMHEAVEEMGKKETFRGYGPEQGYEFLRRAIAENDYCARGVDIAPDEIFVSDGAKSDTGNIGDIFAADCRVAVCDPVYPVYVDTNAMAGRAGEYDTQKGMWDNLIYMPCTEENGFMPKLPEETPDIIYLCFPNNPSGAAMKKDELKKWVDYANEKKAVILYDAAYEAYISEDDVPHSIFEIEGAKTCAIEFKSFSKNAGFTGQRCGYTVIPKELKAGGVEVRSLWNRRHTTKFNGVPYVTQRAAEAVYSESGKKETRKLIEYYMENAKIITEGLKNAGFTVYGGVNSPYVWLKVPNNMTSWEFFDMLLDKASVVGTPGSGFGPSGEGYFRLTAFGSRESTKEAIDRITKAFK